MADLKLNLLLYALVHCFLSLLHSVHCEVDLDELLKGINIHKNSLNQSALTESSKAKCVAEKIAKDLYNDLPCSHVSNGDALVPANKSQLPQFPDYSRKCKVSINHTVDGVIFPVYMPELMENLMLTSCIHSQVAKYLSNPSYTKVGLATHKDCLVVALGTDTDGGSFSAGFTLVPNIGWGYWLGFIVCWAICLFW